MLDTVQTWITTYSWIDKRIITKVLKGFSGKVLDVGCGNKRLQHYLPPSCEYVGIDFNPAADIKIDISQDRYPFDDNSFDYVICNAVLEHVNNDNYVLEEIFRVLKPGGTLYVSIPFMQPYHADPEDYRRYTSYGLAHLLKQHNFVPLEPLEAYGTLLTIEYLIIAEFGKYLRFKKRLINPFRWVYLGLLVLVFGIAKIGNLLLYPLQKHDTYISPGSKYIAQKPTNS